MGLKRHGVLDARFHPFGRFLKVEGSNGQGAREALSQGARRHYATARAWAYMASRALDDSMRYTVTDAGETIATVTDSTAVRDAAAMLLGAVYELTRAGLGPEFRDREW